MSDPYDKGEDPPIQKDPISRDTGVQSEEAVEGEGEPTQYEAGTKPPSSHGVGENVSRRGEEQAEEHAAEGTKGASDRPYGTRSGARESTVAPSEPIDEDSPGLPPGDQGG